jgi:hypothetical protein
MVCHATKAVNPMAISFNTLLYQQVKVVSIIVIEEYILTSIASHHHVIEATWNMNARFSCHAAKPGQR